MMKYIYFLLYGTLFSFAFIKSYLFWYSWWTYVKLLKDGYSMYPDYNIDDYVVSDQVAKIVDKKASHYEYMVNRVICYNKPKHLFSKLYMKHMTVIIILFIMIHLMTLPKIIFSDLEISFSIIQILFATIFFISAYFFEKIHTTLKTLSADYVYVPSHER